MSEIVDAERMCCAPAGAPCSNCPTGVPCIWSTADALAKIGPLTGGARRWEPPAELVEPILAARRRGASYQTIADTLIDSGVKASFGGVRRWLKARNL